jgi:hypothetical protein
LLAPPPPPLPRRFRVVETGAELLACTLAIAWLLALALSHLKFISQPGPQEINEPSFWYTTFLLDQGRNPYSPEELPGAAQFFGPLYHGVVLALKPLFGIGYDAHRFLNLLCIAGSLWLLVTRMRRLGSGLGIALLSSTWIYWICLQNIMITARPDALGLLFFLLAIIIPGERRYSLRASAFGLACTFLAFHCKAYFGLALLPTLAGLALLRSWRHAAVAALAFFATLAASIAALDHVFPLCSLETFFMQRNSVAINTSDDISPMHTAMLFERAWPYFLFLAGAALLIPRHLRTWLHQLRQRDPHAIALGLTLALLLLHFAIVYFYMGHNGGALFTYHLHLIFPPLLLLTAFALARASPGLRTAFTVILTAFVALNISVQPVEDNAPAHQRLTELIVEADPVYSSSSAVTDILAHHQRPVHNSGFTLFLPMATMHGRDEWDPGAQAIRDVFDRMPHETDEHLANRSYELVLTSDEFLVFGEMDTLRRHYELTEEVFMPMYFGSSLIQVWKPRPDSDSVDAR